MNRILPYLITQNEKLLSNANTVLRHKLLIKIYKLRITYSNSMQLVITKGRRYKRGFHHRNEGSLTNLFKRNFYLLVNLKMGNKICLIFLMIFTYFTAMALARPQGSGECWKIYITLGDLYTYLYA